jgi:dolichol-phosphate mannosyltransferase
MAKKIQEGCDVVTASYRLPGGRTVGVPLKRRILSDGINILLGLRYSVEGAGTYTNGFRAYRAKMLKKLSKPLITENGFAGGTELFLRVCLAGGKAGEIPFTLRYDYRGADSKIRFVPTIRGYLRLFFSKRYQSAVVHS